MFINGLVYLYLSGVKTAQIADTDKGLGFPSDSRSTVLDELKNEDRAINREWSVSLFIDKSIGNVVVDELNTIKIDYIADSWTLIQKLAAIIPSSCTSSAEKRLVFDAGSSCSTLILTLDVMMRSAKAEENIPLWPTSIFPIEMWDCGTPLGSADGNPPSGLANSCMHEGRIYACVPEEDMATERGCLKDAMGRMLASSSCQGMSVLCGGMHISLLTLAANVAFMRAQPAPLAQSVAHLREASTPSAGTLCNSCHLLHEHAPTY